MTDTMGTARTDHAWWIDRFARRRTEAGPPLYRRRSSVYRRKSAQVAHPLPAALATALADAAPPYRHALALAALAAVLHRYQDAPEAEEIVVGTPLGPEVLPVLVATGPETTFGNLADAAFEALAEAEAQASITGAGLLDALGMGEVTNRNPLFPVVLRIEGLHPPVPDLRNDVTVTLMPDTLTLEYNGNVHAEATVVRLGRHVTTLLADGVADPARPIRVLDMLPADERQAMLAWSDGGAAPVDDRCLHELFESAARAHPDREALVFGTDALSYAEVDARANRLANHLRSLGAGRGQRVGLCVPASPDLLVGMLAVLKSGAAVVPLVPTFPASHNRIAVKDSGTRLVVTNATLRDRFASTSVGVVCLDHHADDIARAPDTGPCSGVTADEPVYVLFTSGSTGSPKGAVLAHRRLVNLVRWQGDRGVAPAGRRTLQRTSIGFDVSFQEIFATWGFGGSLVVAPDEVRDDVSLLPEYVERYGISRLFLPPVALNQLAVTAGLEQRLLPTLREIVVAGEQLQISMPIRRLLHQLDCSLDNQYGPTETHVVTAFAFTGPSMRWAERPPIGRPIRGARTYVLDRWLRPVPVGVPGELYVGGLGPREGYLDEAQTAARYVRDPFAGGGACMYKTGDRTRFLPDGDIEYLGRDDAQVKIRGYRIELGEVEAHLLRLPGIRQAAATVHETEALGKQLTAYLVSDDQPNPVKLRQLMLEHLPGHMVPATSAFVRLERLPLTPTGKVDRRALPPPTRQATLDAGGPLAEGATEETVARIWARALGLGQVGRDANFIELGGHSLVGIQIAAQLNEAYSISLPLRSLLRGTTVAALAAEIDRLRQAGGGEGPAHNEGTANPAGPTVPDLTEVTLPGGQRVTCLQPAEAQYLYLDVFGHRTYDRGGIRYPAGGVVFDVGAHIGLFTLYALERAPDARVFAFEPCPPLFEALRRNTGALPSVRCFPFGLGEARGSAPLTFYPNLTGMTSFHPDAAEERHLLSGILRNLSRLQETGVGDLLAGSDQYLNERLLATTFPGERRTLSEVLTELGLDHVDLLKIDVQKDELAVLRGIAPTDWPKVAQLTVEVHELSGRLAAVTTLLAGQGYRVTVEQDPLHAGTPVHFVAAVRA